MRLAVMLPLLLAIVLVEGSKESDENLPTQDWTRPVAGGRWRTPGGMVKDDSGAADLSDSEPPTGMGNKEWARIMAQMREELAAGKAEELRDSDKKHSGKEEL